jgi:hypothetical protein
VFTRPTMGGVTAAVVAASAPLVPAAKKPVVPPSPIKDKHERSDSDHHDAFEDANFAASDEDDIPFDFDNSKPAGPQDHHDAPF